MTVAGSASYGEVDAVVVNYNAGDALVNCVRSLLAQPVTTVLVVDNDSTDGSLAALEAHGLPAQIIRTHRNLGYGGGVNRGLEQSRAPLVLMCNPDVVLEPGAVERLRARLLSAPDVALVGPRLVSLDGEQLPSARAFPTVAESWAHAFLGLLNPGGRRARTHRAANARLGEEDRVDWVSGACMLGRRDALEEVTGFDERYFMYLEEADLAWRLRQHGWRTCYEPSATVTHLGGVSSAQRPLRMIVAHHESLWRFARTSTRGRERVLLPAVALGISLRCAIAVVLRAVPGKAGRSRPERQDGHAQP